MAADAGPGDDIVVHADRCPVAGDVAIVAAVGGADVLGRFAEL